MSKKAIFGAGHFGKLFYQALLKAGVQIDFFIDDFKNHECFNLPIIKGTQINKNTTIYISVLQHSEKIEGRLKDQGFSNVLNFSQSIINIPGILSQIAQTDYLWLVKDRLRMLNQKIGHTRKLLKDNKSKLLLDKIIKLRETLDTGYYIYPMGKEYFPKDVPFFNLLNHINFIDCGAYTGDTIKELMESGFPVNYTISFEPDQDNYIKLLDELCRQKQNFYNTSFTAYPVGVYSKNTILAIKLNESGSYIDEIPENATTTTLVSVVSLDKTIKNSSPNYIKLDIEGAEKEAIIGATKTIQEHKPNLAVSLYHKPEDLWELPLLIHDIEPSYDMYLRVHEDLCLSTILYCVPNQLKL